MAGCPEGQSPSGPGLILSETPTQGGEAEAGQDSTPALLIEDLIRRRLLEPQVEIDAEPAGPVPDRHLGPAPSDREAVL